MKPLLLALILLLGPLAEARTYYVYGGRVALGPRFGSHDVLLAQDLAFSAVHPLDARAAREFRRLNPVRAYRCQLDGRVRLVGVQAATGAMLSEFRLKRLTKCRPTAVRTMIAAHRTLRR